MYGGGRLAAVGEAGRRTRRPVLLKAAKTASNQSDGQTLVIICCCRRRRSVANAAAFELWIGATDLSATNPEMKCEARLMDGFTVDLFRGNPSAAQVAAKAAQGFTMVGQAADIVHTNARGDATNGPMSTALIRDFVLATNQSALWMSLIEDDIAASALRASWPKARHKATPRLMMRSRTGGEYPLSYAILPLTDSSQHTQYTAANSGLAATPQIAMIGFSEVLMHMLSV